MKRYFFIYKDIQDAKIMLVLYKTQKEYKDFFRRQGNLIQPIKFGPIWALDYTNLSAVVTTEKFQ